MDNDYSYHKFMEEISISKFKAQCLRLLDEVSRSEKPLVITRNGQPLAVIYPVLEAQKRISFGIAKGSGEILGDIISPATDTKKWESLQ